MAPVKIRVLLVEDNDGDARLIQESLAEAQSTRFALTRAARLDDALMKLKASTFDVILLDLSLPDVRGLETLRRVIATGVTTPIVIMTGLDAEEIGLQAVKEGAQDYLVKGEPASLALARTIRHAIERQHVDAALRASVDELRILAEAMPQIVWITRPDGWTTYFNRHWMEYTGLSLEESLGHGWNKPFHPDDQKGAWNAWQKATSERGTYVNESRLRRADGVYRWWLIRGVPLIGADGGVLKWHGTCTDIHDLKLAELRITETNKMLSESASSYRHLFNAAADPIFIIEPITRLIEDVNVAVEGLYGYAREELIGKDAIILTDEPEATNASLKRMQSENSEITKVRSHRRKDGSVFSVEIHYSSFIKDNRKMLVAVVRDISVRVEAQRKVEKSEAQLRQAQKMEAIGRLAGGVAHDFNNLLTAIGGYGGFLLDSLSPEDQRRGDVEQILKAAERAASLTRQMLAFSRQQALQTKILDCNAVVADILKMLQRIVGEDVKLVAALAAEPGLIKADPSQIDQVLLNLVVNAKDAMPKGGKITIETSNVDLDENYARMHLQLQSGPYVMFAVTDTGTGMDAQTKAHLFEPFFTTKEQGKGTGLGLATVYGIVKQSGGGIYVYSELGHGTTFKVYFPRMQGVAAAAKMIPEPKKSFSGSETILLVEDDELVRAFVHRTLLQQGYAVLVAHDPGEAVRLCEKNTKPIHLILTDVIMPQMHGPDLVKRISPLHPESKVIYMSGYTDTTVAHPGLVDSGVPFLQKPLSPEVMNRKVREVLDGPL